MMTTPHTDTARALPTGTWRLHPAQTTIAVAAKKLGLFRVPATLKVSSGVIETDAGHQVAAVEVVADASSYTSRNAIGIDKLPALIIGRDLELTVTADVLAAET
jgi:polyisoprenoid-binding protein YceI